MEWLVAIYKQCIYKDILIYEWIFLIFRFSVGYMFTEAYGFLFDDEDLV
jgi:hypothetical protein